MESKELVRTPIEEAFNKGNLSVLEEISREAEEKEMARLEAYNPERLEKLRACRDDAGNAASGDFFANNFVQMFIFWELVGVSSYVLIGHWYQKDTAADAAKAVDRGDKNLADVMITDIPRVTPDTPAIELFPLLAESRYPVAVVNETDNLKGVIVKGTLLAALAESTQANSRHMNPN